MLLKNLSVHFKIINSWLAFILFLVVISNFNHQEIHFFSWLNAALYFLIFLLSLFIFYRERFNKAIFINIGLLCFIYSLCFINILIGDNYLFGDKFLSFYVFQYRTILQSLLLAIAVIYICIKYIFKHQRPSVVYGITLAVILPIFFWHFHPFLLDKNYLLNFDDNIVLYKSLLYFTFLPLTFIVLYGFFLYRYDESLGEHINALMVCFFIMLLMDITDIFSRIYGIKLFEYSQYVLLLVLSFFIVTLFKKLNFIYSEFGQFYETIVFSGKSLGVPIKRKKSPFVASLLRFANAYFHHRRNLVSFVMLFLILCINYFHISLFIKINMAVLALGALILFFYLSALYQKRLSHGDLLNLKRNR